MTRKQSLIFKLAILFFGLVIIFALFVMFGSSLKSMLPKERYLWVNVTLIYLIFMYSSLFVSIGAERFSKTAFPIITIWSLSFIYLIFGSALIFLVMMEFLIIKVAILLQMIVFFIFAIVMFVGAVIGSHIANVETKENMLREKLSMLKQKALILKSELKEEDACHKDLAKLMESFNFLSPVSTIQAQDIEEEILEKLDMLQCSLDNNEVENIEKIKTELNRLYQMRKIILQ